MHWSTRLTSRRIIIGLSAVIAVQAAAATAGAVVASRLGADVFPTSVEVENRRSGSSGWSFRPEVGEEIEAYAWPVSLGGGDELGLRVYAPDAARYRIEIYRIGWYGGNGGRLMRCLPTCGQYRSPEPQGGFLTESVTGELRALWHVTDRVRISRSWLSGYYVAKVRSATGRVSADVPFVVRASPPQVASILVIAPLFTWQAYNAWGGRSFYTEPPTTHATFHRPWDKAHLQHPARLEFPLVRFLEQRGFATTYATDVDIDDNPNLLLHHKVVVLAGHSEYWTPNMRAAIGAAVRSGVNLIVAGGSTGYWQVRFDPARATVVNYRSASADPSTDDFVKTARFRDPPLNRSECKLLGAEWQGGYSEGTFDYVVNEQALAHRWFRGTGFRKGSRVIGAVAYEWDAVQPGCHRRGITVFFHHRGENTSFAPGTWRTSFRSTNADALVLGSPSGAYVFNTGSLYLAWSLTGSRAGGFVGRGVTDPRHPPDARMARFMENVVIELSGQRVERSTRP